MLWIVVFGIVVKVGPDPGGDANCDSQYGEDGENEEEIHI